MSSPESQIFRFEDVEIDAWSGRLKCAGEERHLRQKAFSVLVYLVEQRGRVISKDELMNEVWKDTAVTDDALVQCIRDIRRALNDDSHSPRFVRTIPKIGYRFIGPLSPSFNGSVITQVEEITHVELEIEESISDTENGRRGDGESSASLSRRVTASPRLRVAASPRLLLTAALVLVLATASLVYLALFRTQTEEVRLPAVPGRKSVAVMHLENRSGDPQLDWLREGLTDMLIANLSRSDKLNVLSRNRLHLLLERVGASENIQPHQAVEVARKAQAESFITGSFARIGEKVRLDVQIYATQTGDLQASETLTVERADQILTEIDLLSLRLLAQLSATAKPETNLNLSQTMTDNLEAYRYYSLAVEKAQGLHNKEAIELLEKAVALDPEFAMAHARIGYVYALAWAFPDKAKPFLEKAFQLSERLTEKDRLYILAWYAIANLDYPSAIQPLREIIDKYPFEIEAYGRLASVLGEGREEEAIGVLKQGLAVDPEDKYLYNALGGILSSLGRHKEALAMRLRYVALAPHEPNAYDSLGLVYQHSGNYPEAIAQYDRALELKPDFEVALIHLANTRFQQGRYREAIELFRRYIAIAPSDIERARGYYSLSTIYRRLKNFTKAEEAMKACLKNSNDFLWASAVLALERGDRVGKDLEERSLADSIHTSRGVKRINRDRLKLRGLLALKKGQAEEALERFREALRLSPPVWNLEDFEDALANVYLEIGRFDEAVAEYERILRINPNYPLAHFHLAQAFEQTGQHERAQENYRRFLETWKDADADIPEVIIARKQIG